VFAEHEG